ncbi:MAG: DUF4387 domain-containing protein [Gemmatimonadota bacterium]
MKTNKLSDLAKTIRSKNAGVDKITFDVIFRDRDNYERVKKSGVLSRAAISRLYAIDEARISDFVEYDPGCAIKFTFYRPRPSGSAGDPDIFGSQQYAPLLDVEVPAG